MNFDYTLYLVTDRQLMSCDSLTEAVEQAILGGCTMIQLREKELSSLEFYNQAVAVKQVTDKYHIPLIINDRIDIAMAVLAQCSLLELKPTLILYQWKNYRKSAQPFLCR